LDGQLDFKKLFFEQENKLIKQGYEVITSTNPRLLYSVTYIADKLPNAYFIFVNRDQQNVASEIFTTDYNKGNYYSYDPNNIMEYLNFYTAASDQLEVKAPNRIIHFSFEQMIENPSSIVEIISDFTSVNFGINSSGFDGKILSPDSIFRTHFQKLIQA
jgi:hypothetical protein